MLATNEIKSLLAEHYDLAPSMEKAEATREIYSKTDRVIPLAEWAVYAPYVIEINRLKKERNAVILAHNYMTPEIYHALPILLATVCNLRSRQPRSKKQ